MKNRFKFERNESVWVACSPFRMCEATVLSCHAEKQAAGNYLNFYRVVLAQTGEKVRLEECSVFHNPARKDSGRRHKRPRPQQNTVKALREDRKASRVPRKTARIKLIIQNLVNALISTGGKPYSCFAGGLYFDQSVPDTRSQIHNP